MDIGTSYSRSRMRDISLDFHLFLYELDIISYEEARTSYRIQMNLHESTWIKR